MRIKNIVKDSLELADLRLMMSYLFVHDTAKDKNLALITKRILDINTKLYAKQFFIDKLSNSRIDDLINLELIIKSGLTILNMSHESNTEIIKKQQGLFNKK